MTKFSFEVPIDYLEEFHEFQDFGFALSFLMGEKSYKEYFQTYQGVWILDNSFNEIQKPESPWSMAKYYKDLLPSLVISPDSDQWDKDQVAKAFEFLAESVPLHRIIGIFKTEVEFFALAKKGCSNWASSYAHRSLMPEWLLKMPNHFLGCLGPQEIHLLRPESCDTSMPVKLALAECTVDQWILNGCPHILSKPGFFYTKLSPREITLAKQNIIRFKEVCNG